MWRLLEVGEVIEKGDESYRETRWDDIGHCLGWRVTASFCPIRRKIEPVSVGDRVEVVSGTWSKSCGVVVGILPMNLKITLENVFVGGSMLTLIVGKSSVTALKSAPKASVQVDPEWRLLEIGEVIREGDEYCNGYWKWRFCIDYMIDQTIGKFHCSLRRRVRIESPGWRYLDAGETVQAGDEIAMRGSMAWESANLSTGSKVGSTPNDKAIYFFRRKTTPFEG